MYYKINPEEILEFTFPEENLCKVEVPKGGEYVKSTECYTYKNFFIGAGFDLNVYFYPYKEYLKQPHSLTIKSLKLEGNNLIIRYEKKPIKSHPDFVKEESSKKKEPKGRK